MVSEANHDEALRCLDLSRKQHLQGDVEAATRLALKALRMNKTNEATQWYEQLQRELAAQTANTPPAQATDPPSAQATDPPAASEDGLRQRKVPIATERAHESTATSTATSAATTASYSEEQLREVKAFTRINKDDFYAVLAIEKSATDAEIKRAYKKVCTLQSIIPLYDCV